MKRNLRLCLLALLLSTPFCLMAQSPARYGFLNRAAVIAILPETARTRISTPKSRKTSLPS